MKSMEYDVVAGEIKLGRELNELDKFVLDFVSLLDDKYVVVSGYVSILFGRSRATEDVDLLVPYLEKNEFIELFRKVHREGFECLNTSDAEEAFDLWHGHAIRFARVGEPIPNMEFKMVKTGVDRKAYDEKISVLVGSRVLFISPLELQIAYKRYFLSSEKDEGDALHLEELFKSSLDYDKINKDKELVESIK